MTRYWVNFKGNQSGPHSIEELKRMGVDKSAYVWHSGLDDWVKITKVAELNDMLEGKTEVAVDDKKPSDEIVEARDEHEEDVATSSQQEDEVPEIPKQLEEDEVPEIPEKFLKASSNSSRGGFFRSSRGSSSYFGGSRNSQCEAASTGTPKCPPTNLVWSIIITLCCCVPLGVVGIIFAYLTKKHYNQGNYEKAEKFSELGAWTCIIAIMIGVVTAPLSCAYMGRMM